MTISQFLQLLLRTFPVNPRDVEFCMHPQQLIAIVPVQDPRTKLYTLRMACRPCTLSLLERLR